VRVIIRSLFPRISDFLFFRLCVAALLLGVDMPNDVVGQADDLVTRPLGHLSEAFGFRLVFKGIGGEVNS